MREFSENFDRDINQLSMQDWLHVVHQSKPLSRSQKEQIKYSISHKGAPDQIRGRLWTKLLDIDQAMLVHADNLYSKLIEFDNEEVSREIGKDVDRTMAELGLWKEDSKCGNNKLYNVLLAYANYDNEVGYVQGLNYIVGLLLFYIPDEEQVFWCLHQLMQKKNWREVYTHNFPKLKSLVQLLEDRLS